MNRKLQFDFIVDKENHVLTVRREFAAARQLVWDCYTKAGLLERWFAPKPLTARTRSMDFREGGHWEYAMVEPDGKEHWGRIDYETIQPLEGYTGMDGFCYENGDLNPDLPRAHWDVKFQDRDNHCLVETVVTYRSVQDLEIVIRMGMEEGLTATLEELDELLSSLSR